MFNIETIWHDLVIEINPLINEAEQGCLLIGLGTDAEQLGVSLNNKTDSYRHFHSVSEIVAKSDNKQWDEWRAKFDNGQALKRIVIEDFSLDTCFALLTFLSNINKAGTTPDVNSAWLDYVNAWEEGVFLDGDDIKHSAGCLLSALAHSYWANQRSLEDGHYIKAGLKSCLLLLKEMIKANPDPTSGIRTQHNQHYAKAITNIAYEKQVYDQIIKRSVRCQLLVDTDQNHRHSVVDALFITESSPSGILKILARTDKQNSWTRKGFGLLGVYRPNHIGSGNDMVISVEPTSGARLDKLWYRLEELENTAWQGNRPRDNPRYLISYLDKKTNQLTDKAPNQPWYDDQGKMTLLAAPKRVSADELGSKLQWGQDVLPAIWDCYFTQLINDSIEVVNLPELESYTGNKIIKVYQHKVKSCSKGTIDPLMKMIDTTTFHAWLASHITNDEYALTPMNLPTEDEFESRWYGNILVVSYRQGVVLFSNETANIHEQHNQLLPHNCQQLTILINAILAVAEVSSAYDNFIKNYATQIETWIEDLLSSHKTHHSDKKQPLNKKLSFSARKVKAKKIKRMEDWEEMIFETKVQALKALDSSKIIGNDILHNKITESLTSQWGLSKQRNQLIGQIERLDSLMRQSIAHRKEKRQRVYGAMFSALALGTAASHVWEPIKVMSMTNMYEWLLMLFREEPRMTVEELREVAENIVHYEMYSVLVLLGFGFLGFVLFWFFDFASKGDHH